MTKLEINGRTFNFGNKSYVKTNKKSPRRLGASKYLQSKWQTMGTVKRAMKRKFMLDRDKDGVPDYYDCEPYNSYAQDDNYDPSLPEEFPGLTSKDIEMHEKYINTPEGKEKEKERILNYDKKQSENLNKEYFRIESELNKKNPGDVDNITRYNSAFKYRKDKGITIPTSYTDGEDAWYMKDWEKVRKHALKQHKEDKRYFKL